MLKKLVLYYSYEGSTAFVAENIASAIDADLLPLKVKHEMKTHGFLKYFWGGRQVLMKKKPEIHPLELLPEDYDVLFLGTPVWAFTYSPPFHTLFSELKLCGKKIALFCCCDGNAGKTFQNFKYALEGNRFVGEKVFLHVSKAEKSKVADEAQQWAQEIMQSI